MNRRDIQIFLTVFLIIGLFAQVYSLSANSRIDLTRSIVERGALDINPYRNNTADRSYYQGDYYSDKEPGLPFAGAVIYGAWHTIYSLAGDTTIHDSAPYVTILSARGHTIRDTQAPGAFYLWTLIVLILFTSTVSFAALTVLIYRFSAEVLDREWLRLLVTFGFAFGTPHTHTAGTFLPNALASLLIFGSFYIIYHYETSTLRHREFLAGLSGGLAVIVEPLNVIGLAAVFFYAWRRFGRVPARYFLGGFVGGLPFMVYNTVLFGAPWNLPRSYLDPVFWPHLQEGIGFVFDPVRTFFVSLRVLFYPYRGIFYWFPFLLVSVVGVPRLYRNRRTLFWCVASIFAAGTLLVATWWEWWHGGFFGPRRMTFLIPFMMIAVMYGARTVRDRGWSPILVLLVAVSVAVNVIGTYGYYESELRAGPDKPFQMAERYKEQEKSFQVMENPIFDVYLPGFLKYGPQSYILSGLYKGSIPPDIRAYTHTLEESRVPPILLLWAVIIVVGVIWRREIRTRLDDIDVG